MNPEIRRSAAVRKYFSPEGVKPKEPAFLGGPIGFEYRKNSEVIVKRSRWLLDFTDSHPLFYGQSHVLIEDTASHAKDLFSQSIGREHRERWEQLGENKKDDTSKLVKEAAIAMSHYGYDLTGDIINKLDYHSKNNTDHYVKIDKMDPFENYPIRNALQKLSTQDPLFKRILNLIKYTATQNYPDADATLAVFSTVVGFAQSYTDGVAKNEGWNKGRKHTVRDTVLLYALYQYDHGLREYLEALNEVDLSHGLGAKKA